MRIEVVFETGLYQNPGQTATPAGWTAIAPGWPDFSQPINNYSLSTNIRSILPGESLGGFSVQFEYPGTGMPGSQQFSVYESSAVDPTAEATDTGFTQISSIPGPAAVWRFGSGLASLIGLARYRKSAQ